MADTDLILLRNMRVVGTHGVLEEEKVRAQPFEIDVELRVDLGAAGVSDALNDTVDYGAVMGAVDAVIKGESHQLLEKVAHRIATDILAKFLTVIEVNVEVRKLRPPVPHDIAYSAIRVSRRRNS